MNESLKTTRPALACPWIYFLTTYLWSGVFGGLAILMDVSMETAPGLVLVLLAAVGPMVTGIAFTLLALNQVASTYFEAGDERTLYGYALRVLGFVLILAAIIDKNVAARRR